MNREKMEKRGTPALTSGMNKKICPMSKRSQVTLFIIIAIVAVALIVLIYMFWPDIQGGVGIVPSTPQGYIQDCMEEEMAKVVETISLQGGSLNPENSINYLGNEVEYLCYNEEYYLRCVMQQPMLKSHIEDEIENAIRVKTDECFNALQESYEGKGYSVNLVRGDYDVELLPRQVSATFNYPLTLTKQDTERYPSFRVDLSNNLYELVMVATSILNWEARYGDAETTTYMDYYPDLKVEKQKQSDGSTIYILTNRDTGNKFQFASRSIAWPPGYGG